MQPLVVAVVGRTHVAHSAQDARVVAAAGRAGYRTGAALPPTWTADNPLDWPRAGIYHGDDLRRFKLKVSPGVRRVRRLVHR